MLEVPELTPRPPLHSAKSSASYVSLLRRSGDGGGAMAQRNPVQRSHWLRQCLTGCASGRPRSSYAARLSSSWSTSSSFWWPSRRAIARSRPRSRGGRLNPRRASHLVRRGRARAGSRQRRALATRVYYEYVVTSNHETNPPRGRRSGAVLRRRAVGLCGDAAKLRALDCEVEVAER